MKKILIGSSAIKHWFPDFTRDPKDIDYIELGRRSVSSKEGVEILPNPVLENFEGDILTPDYLLTLKMSHLFWDINWDKHMFDVQFLLKKGAKLIPTVFNDLYQYWNEFHGTNKRSDLQMSADDFFDNAMTCPYKHDDIHTILNPVPVYTHILVGEVEVSEDLFQKLSFNQKLDLVREEVMVMAWERMFKLDYRVAYAKMLKKFIRDHAPMWEAKFIIENYIFLIKPEYNYFKKIENGLHKIKCQVG